VALACESHDPGGEWWELTESDDLGRALQNAPVFDGLCPGIGVALQAARDRLATPPQRQPVDGTASGRQPLERTATASNPVGAGVALLGAFLVLIGVFLPIHSYGGVPIAHNSFVASGYWWVLVLPLIVGVSAAYVLAGSGSPAFWQVLIPSLVAVGVGIYGQTSHFQKLETVVNISSSGFNTSTVTGSAAAGVYLVLAGGAVGVVGAGILSGTWGPVGVPAWERRTKRCPDCAETVLADANVCKHCGHRFDSPPSRPLS
jgi:hypothetical protein